MRPSLTRFLAAALISASAAFASPGALRAGEVTDQIMATGLYADSPAGELLLYQLSRSHAEPPEEGWPGAQNGIKLPDPVAGGALSLRRDGEGEAARLTLSLSHGGADQHLLAQTGSTAPNPVLLFWLENTVRAAAVQTGGSPFYLRNRIREALVEARLPAPAEGVSRLVLEPFKSDANRAALGAFADLRLTLAWRAEAPGVLTELLAETSVAATGSPEASAEAAGGYREHLLLKGG